MKTSGYVETSIATTKDVDGTKRKKFFWIWDNHKDDVAE